jgi:hypothetical protein
MEGVISCPSGYTNTCSSATYPQSLRTTSHKSSTRHLEKVLSLRSGTLRARKSTTDYDHSPIPRQIFFSSASQLTAQTRWKTSWTRYVSITHLSYE